MPFQLIRDDITRVKADAIVNTANPKPVCAGGTDAAIYKAAGCRRLLAARRKIGAIGVGQVAVTPAFDLPADYLIHTVGPAWIDGQHGEFEALTSCYEKSLQKAEELNCKSIAFPLIATGVYGFPKDQALQTAVSVISRFLLSHEMDVLLVVFDRKAFELSGKLFQEVEAFIDEHYVAAREQQEYAVSGLRGPSLPRAWLREPEFDAAPLMKAKAPLLLEEAAKASSLVLEEAKTLSPMPLEEAAKAPLPLEEAAKASSPVLEEAKAPLPLPMLAAAASPSLEDAIRGIGETFQQRLLQLIDERGVSDVQVYKKANMDRKLFSKIRCKADYRPGKKTVLALAIALELSLEDTRDLLSRAELALSPSSKSDLIIEYFISRQVYDIYTINMALFQHDEPILGGV